MFQRLLNGNDKYRSWYELSRDEASALEREFVRQDMGKIANEAMHICILIGIFTFVISTICIVCFMASKMINLYNFTILLFLLILGIVVVVASTIEYQMKFNSWLKVSKKIIKK